MGKWIVSVGIECDYFKRGPVRLDEDDAESDARSECATAWGRLAVPDDLLNEIERVTYDSYSESEITVDTQEESVFDDHATVYLGEACQRVTYKVDVKVNALTRVDALKRAVDIVRDALNEDDITDEGEFDSMNRDDITALSAEEDDGERMDDPDDDDASESADDSIPSDSSMGR